MAGPQAGLLALLLLAAFTQLLEEGAAFIACHFVDAGSLFRRQATHHRANPLLGFGRQVVDPGG